MIAKKYNFRILATYQDDYHQGVIKPCKMKLFVNHPLTYEQEVKPRSQQSRFYKNSHSKFSQVKNFHSQITLQRTSSFNNQNPVLLSNNDGKNLKKKIIFLHMQ
jgi:hypothetical protein